MCFNQWRIWLDLSGDPDLSETPAAVTDCHINQSHRSINSLNSKLMTITYPGTIFAWSTLGAFLSEVTLQGTKQIRWGQCRSVRLVRLVTVASCLCSLCLLWVQECRRLLSLRAYPAGRGVLVLQGSRGDRWLPVVYRRRQNLMGRLCKGQQFIHSFYAFIEAKGPIKKCRFFSSDVDTNCRSHGSVTAALMPARNTLKTSFICSHTRRLELSAASPPPQPAP